MKERKDCTMLNIVMLYKSALRKLRINLQGRTIDLQMPTPKKWKINLEFPYWRTSPTAFVRIIVAGCSVS